MRKKSGKKLNEEEWKKSMYEQIRVYGEAMRERFVFKGM
jgi:hypothetical protein